MSNRLSDITIYTTGDRQHGHGHVVRMRLLARLLTERGLRVGFVSNPDTSGWNILAKTGLPLDDDLVPGALGIVDVENGPDGILLRRMRRLFGGLVTVCGAAYPIHEFALIEELSDLVVCQSIFNTHGHPDKVLQGPGYLVIDPVYSLCRNDPDGPIVVVMGGTDPHDLTPRVKAALDYPTPRNGHVLYPHGEPSLVRFFNRASLFIGALGMVAYEAIAAGLPSILYGWSADHVATAVELERQGVARSMGLWSDFDERKLRDVVGLGYWQLKNTGPRLVDGQGAGRVAEAICTLMHAITVPQSPPEMS